MSIDNAGPALATLHNDILAAHAADDRKRLAQLYADAALLFEHNGNIDQAAFFNVQAYVFALDAGDLETAAIAHRFLVRHGREQAPR